MNQETYKTQTIVSGENSTSLLQQFELENIFVVCSKSVIKYYDTSFLTARKGKTYFFNEFSANPQYEEVEKGVALFQKENCKMLVSIGGGSAMDVAKSIKLFATMEKKENYLNQEKKKNDIVHIAIPTTAGTGSESTSFAVIYYEGEKQSVVHESILPDYAVLEKEFLRELPLYQKKSTVLDALCQGIESYWAVEGTEESREYAGQAVREILDNIQGYIFENKNHGEIMLAANKAGRAINISKTTAAHAMSYKITSMYGFAHGHAAAICLPKVWRLMIGYVKENGQAEEVQAVEAVLKDLDNIMGVSKMEEGVALFEQIIQNLGMEAPVRTGPEDIEKLAQSVNVERLSNFPVCISKQQMVNLYEEIVQ